MTETYVSSGHETRAVLNLPIRIQDNSSVAAEEGYLIWQLPLLVQGDDGECATATRLPVDRQELGVRLVTFGYYVKSTRMRESDSKGTLTRLVSHAFLLMWRLS